MALKNTVIMNGRELAFEPGQTILEVAEQNGLDIPTLCFLRGTSPSDKCRICVVEVGGAGGLMLACSTPATNNMIIETESPGVAESRREALRQRLATGNHNCMIAQPDEDVHPELRPKTLDEVSTGAFAMEAVNPLIIRDFSRCIQCGRCIKACNEVQVNNAIILGYVGETAKVMTPGDTALKDSDCVFCGECVQACPVGALVEKDARYNVRSQEADRVRTTCGYCGVGCQIELHVRDNKVVRVTGVESAAPNFGSLCVKGRFGYHFINSPDRLTTPLIKQKDGTFREATWDEALDHVAGNLTRIKDAHGPDSMGVLVSARATNEDNYVANRFARAVLKTNNIDHCARL